MLFIVLSFPTLSIIADQVEASGDDLPVITISLDEGSKTACSSPTEEVPVTFEVTITCHYPETVPVDPTINVSLKMRASWWNITEPPPIHFNLSSTETTFNVTIVVPVNTSADEDVRFEIWGSWSYCSGWGWGGLEKVSAVIDILPFYDLYIGSNEPIRYCDVGEWVTYPFVITNRANTDANITLEIKKDASVIEHRIDERMIHLRKGETRIMNLSVKQIPSASRRNTIHVIAVFQDDPDSRKYNLPLELRTSPTFSTFIYERNFIFLVSVMILISIVAVGLFIFEKVKGRQEENPDPVDMIEENDIG
ncbi:MAG: choice-of-anchor T family protein [Thermoplasmatota archaeon]